MTKSKHIRPPYRMWSTADLADLRERLFAAIDGVKDGSVSIDQAKQISELSQVVVNLAKVEVDYARVTEHGASEFLAPEREQLPNGITSIVTHRIK